MPEVENNWLLMVAYIHPHTYASTSSDPRSGIYGTNGTQYATLTDFKRTSTATFGSLRTYLQNSTTTTEKHFWYDPRFELVDGTEPSLEQLYA